MDPDPAHSIARVLEQMKTHVVSISADACLSDAVDLMDLYQVPSLPVLSADEQLCGMLSECDVLRKLYASAATARIDRELLDRLEPGAASIAEILVSEAMTSPAIFVRETDSARSACSALLQHGLKRLPVLRSDGKVVGVLNRIDVLQALFEGTL